MKRILYIIIVLLSMLAPVERLDIAKLLPVEAVAVCCEKSQILLKTDQGNVGRGQTAEEALKNLKENTVPIVYLDTAEYLLVGDGAESAAAELRRYLKPWVRQVSYRNGDVMEQARYLDAHWNRSKPVG